MVVVAKAHAQLVGDGSLLDAADEDVHVLFFKKAGQFQWVGIVHDDGSLVADLIEFLVVLLGAGLGTDQHHLHAQQPESLDQREGLEGAADVDGGFFPGERLPELLDLADTALRSSSRTSSRVRAMISGS